MIDLRLGVGCQEIVGGDKVESVTLTDGTSLDADVVVGDAAGASGVVLLVSIGPTGASSLSCNAIEAGTVGQGEVEGIHPIGCDMSHAGAENFPGHAFFPGLSRHLLGE